MIAAPTSLAAFFEALTRRLRRAAEDRRAAWRTPALATIDADGAPRTRIVVLRAVSADMAQLEIHTDQRSEKWREIGRASAVSLLFWDPGPGLQLRAEGAADLLAADVETDAIFDRLGPGGQAIYGARPAPGAALTRPDEADLGGPARPHFGRIVVTATRLEALWLGRDGHRRARWIRGPADRSGRAPASAWDAGAWLAP